MTVISELLSTTYSNKSFLHSTAFPNHQQSQLHQFHPGKILSFKFYEKVQLN